MERTKEKIVTTTVLARCQKEILGSPTEYLLCLDREDDCCRYHIQVTRQGEKCSCDFGDDIINTVKIFEAIVQGEIFPYSLAEIAEDFAKA